MLNRKSVLQINVPSPTSTTVEYIFESLKDSNKNTVSINKFYNTIETAGMRLSDPRLKQCVDGIASLQRTSLQKEDRTAHTYHLDQETFTRLIQPNLVILHKILQNDFVCPQFRDFTDEVNQIYAECSNNNSGKCAEYIPQLARVNPKLWGVSVCTIDGQRHDIGDTKIPFCLQSISKPLNYAIAITTLGSDVVHKYVGYEPSGETFNAICLNKEDKPHNPLINSGAIVLTSLLQKDLQLPDRFDYVMKEYKRMAGDEYMGFNNAVFLSERATADRNFALTYYMKEKKCFPPGVNTTENLDFYFQLCSIETRVESCAVMAGTLANGGICPLTGERVMSQSAVRETLSLMHSCGMYDYSGQFAFKCGLPAKSGVSGAILLVIPNLMGMCIWSPPLDAQGNSCRGIQFCEELVRRFNMHNYDSLLYTTNKIDPRRNQADIQAHTIVSLLFAAYNNDIGALRRSYLQLFDMNQSDYDGRVALHLAAAEGHLSAVKFLVETCKVNINTADRWGHTAISESERFGKTDVTNYLKSHSTTLKDIQNGSLK